MARARRRRRVARAHPSRRSCPARAADTARLLALAATPGAQHRAGPLRRDARPLAQPALRDVHVSLPACRPRRTSSAAASTTSTSPASPARSAATTSGSGATSTSCAWRCRSAPATGGDDAANRFVPARVAVPIQPGADPREALRARARAADAPRKSETAIGAAEGLAGALHRRCPTAFLVAMTRAQTRTTDFAATNLRGSPVPLYIAGARMLANYPFGPRTGTALNATRAQLLRRPQHRASTSTRPRSPTSTRSWPTRRVVRRAARVRLTGVAAVYGPDARAVALDRVEPLGVAGIAPPCVPALGGEVDHVEVQRRRVVGQLDEVARAGMRLGARRAGRRARPSRAPGSGTAAHADTVASSSPAVTASSASASPASSSTSCPSSSRNRSAADHEKEGTSCRSLGPGDDPRAAERT